MNETTSSSRLSRPLRIGIVASLVLFSGGFALAAQTGRLNGASTKADATSTADAAPLTDPALVAAPPASGSATPATIVRYEDVYVVDPAPPAVLSVDAPAGATFVADPLPADLRGDVEESDDEYGNNEYDGEDEYEDDDEYEDHDQYEDHDEDGSSGKQSETPDDEEHEHGDESDD